MTREGGWQREPDRPGFRCTRCAAGSIGAYDPLNRRPTTIADAREQRRRMVCRACYVDLRDATTAADLDYEPKG